MEKALLGGESSGGLKSTFSRWRDESAHFLRRSDAISQGSLYQKAAALVDLAEDGVGLPEQILDQSSYETAAKIYFIYIRLDFLWALNYFALIVLNFLEKPMWCHKYSEDSCSNREYYFLGELPYLTGVESLVYEGVTVIILILHTFFPISYEGFRIYWKSHLNKLKVISLLILVADLLVDVLYVSPVTDFNLPFRVAPYIRVVVFILSIRTSRWFCLFFILYVLLGVYFVSNLILAVVYDSFKSQLVKQVAEKDRMRKRILGKAFNLIDKNDQGYLDKDQCILLFEALNTYRTLPKISREDFELIFDELDDSHDFKINMDEFADLCHAIAMQFQKEDSPSCFEKFPAFYHSCMSEKLKAFVQGPMFGYVVAFILILNLVAVIIETTLDIENNSAQQVWQKVEFVFGWLYVVEMALKIYAYGFENYWRDGQNRFDFFITWVIVIGETATFLSPDDSSFLSNGEWIRYLILARMLRFFRLLMHVQRYRAFLATFLSLIPSLMPYLGTIFCVMCIYCSLGVQIFGGIVHAGNPKLDGTGLDENDYLLFNFNDYPNGMVTLFNLLVMNDWQVWMQSYTDLTGTSWTYMYFISFYLIAVLLLLSLVVAFVLEAFFAEMELETSEKCEDPEQEGGGKSRRRYIGPKSSSERVDALLHHMLSSELVETERAVP
ncbi:two pore calcium channel protein 1 isoform X3 [Rhododendron vialii]|uniref:two pore calcium channel protein 1 isoform X3 n=1 Tax=Rhododendron vialii TaxID=182163 RepID=UPI00265E9F26|nr:two pore calcium channel protein 1 isoform X3 [Rhododendron vialii]